MAYVGKRVKIGSTCTISNEKIIEPDRVIEDGVTEWVINIQEGTENEYTCNGSKGHGWNCSCN